LEVSALCRADRTFRRHDDGGELCRWYNGCQGAKPQRARVVLVGTDANFPVCLPEEEGPVRFVEHWFYHEQVKPFLQDPTGWFEKTGARQRMRWPVPWNDEDKGIQHPFLLPLCESWKHDMQRCRSVETAITAAGQSYHLRLWLILSVAGVFAQNQTRSISFSDLLQRPTSGTRSRDHREYKRLLDEQMRTREGKEHLARIFTEGPGKMVVLMFGSRTRSLIGRYLREFIHSDDDRAPSEREPVVQLTSVRGVKVFASLHPSARRAEPLLLSLASELKRHLGADRRYKHRANV
jgi:hypothetical protein